jgi:hypothetical protein
MNGHRLPVNGRLILARFFQVKRKDGIEKALKPSLPRRRESTAPLKYRASRLRGGDEKITSATFCERIRKTKQKKTPVSRLILRIADARRRTKGNRKTKS